MASLNRKQKLMHTHKCNHKHTLSHAQERRERGEKGVRDRQKREILHDTGKSAIPYFAFVFWCRDVFSLSRMPCISNAIQVMP